MSHWFYAVIDETAAWFNAAVKAPNEQMARAKLARLYPHGRVHSISR